MKDYWSSKTFYLLRTGGISKENGKEYVSKNPGNNTIFIRVTGMKKLFLVPLWNSRALTKHFLKHIPSVAVTVGVSALDENQLGERKGRWSEAT